MAGAGASPWMSDNPAKRWTEVFFLWYSPVWITWALGIVVTLGLYHRFRELEYMYVGLAAGLPCVLIPPLLPPAESERGVPLRERYWVKANVWIAIFSFVGNYFWTHYFFALLGAAYTFPSWTLNRIPIPLYLLTHAYFCFYHTLSNLTMRRLDRLLRAALPQDSLAARAIRGLVTAAWVVALSYATAFMETLTIANFDYYTFVDKGAMYRVGSLFYALYFVVSFPMFLRIEEDPKEPKWSLARTAVDALGASMLVTILLDFWRLAVGPIVDIKRASSTCSAPLSEDVVWM